MKSTEKWMATVAAIFAFAAGSAEAADLTHNAASTLTLTDASSWDNVKIGNLSTSANTIVDATGTTSFTSNGILYVGAGPSVANGMTGTLKLGISNAITASQITIGGLTADNNASAGHAGLVTTLANGTTTINTADMAIGTGKGNGTQIAGQTGGKFSLGSGATLNLYGLTGSNSRASLTLGRLYSDGGRAVGVMDLSAGTSNLVLSQLLLGKVTQSSPLGGLVNQGTLTLGTSASNHLDISGTGNVVQIGSINTGANVPTTATLTIGNLNSTSSITSTTDGATAVLIASRPTTGTVTGTMNFNGGTLKITTVGADTAAIAGGGGTSNLNLSGGAKLVVGASSSNWIKSLTTATLGTGGATIDTDGKTIGISQVFTGAGGLIKDGAGIMTLSTAQGYTGATEVKAGELNLTGSLHASSAVTVRSGASISGTGTVNGSLAFDSGANLRYGASPLSVTGNVTFGGFSVANLLNFDFASATLDTPYTLITGANVSLTNVANYDVATAGDVGGGRKAYFQTGSLQLVVIPEPATLSMIGVIGIAMLLRRRIVRG